MKCESISPSQLFRMFQLTDGNSTRDSRVLLFHHFVIFFLLVQPSAGQSTVTNLCQSVSVTVGQDTILPCQLEPARDASSMTLEWTRSDLSPRFVHVWRDGKDALADQNPAYKGRTSLSIEKLKHGNISLKISAVELSDNGTYRCYVPDLNKESFTCLAVDVAPSTPVWKIVLIVIAVIITVIIACATGCQVDCCPCVELLAEL